MTIITRFSSDLISQHIDELIHMLKLTVDNGASIGWLAPLPEDEAKRYWLSVQTQVSEGNKILLVAQQGETLVGSVQLALETRANGNHRGEVQKLMVHMDYRRQGIARQLMQALDTAAIEAKLSLLVLDVRKGDPAEMLYRKIDYVHVGDIPDYARSNETEYDTTAYYYKKL